MWNELFSEDQLQTVVALSHEKPQLIFKHSTTCSISRIAKTRLDDDIKSLNKVFDLYYFDLLAYRSVSNQIAANLEVHHESPQVIVLFRGETTFDESHLDISVDELLEHSKLLLS